MDAILYNWPFVALACGVIGVVALLFIGSRRDCLKEPSFLVCFLLPVYMIHQFEEHGIDMLGRRYHFIRELCGTLGHQELTSCPADPWFILAVNVGAVWIAGITAIIWRKKNPLVGIFAFGIPLVNGIAHLLPAMKHGVYNSGLVTGVVVFVPLGVYVIRTSVAQDVLPRPRVPFVILTGGLLHAILLGALIAYDHGSLSRSMMLAIETLNGFVPLAFGQAVAAATRRSS